MSGGTTGGSPGTTTGPGMTGTSPGQTTTPGSTLPNNTLGNTGLGQPGSTTGTSPGGDINGTRLQNGTLPNNPSDAVSGARDATGTPTIMQPEPSTGRRR
jgi:hypothetical protein